jgi:PAS domain S-box-containing protein
MKGSHYMPAPGLEDASGESRLPPEEQTDDMRAAEQEARPLQRERHVAPDDASGVNHPREQLSPDELVQVAWVVRDDGRIEDQPPRPSLRVYCGHPVESVDEWLDTVHPRERARMRADWQYAQLTRRAFATECQILRRDWLYRYFSLHVVPIRMSETGELQWVCSGIDITTRKQHQQKREMRMHTRAAVCASEQDRLKLRAQVSEARFQRLLEADVVGMAVQNGQEIVEANDAFLRLLGYTREEVLAAPLLFDEITAPSCADATARATREALAAGACVPCEQEYIRSDGSHVPVLVGKVLVDSEPPQFVIFAADLTRQRQLEREREEARAHEVAAVEISRNLDDFVATAAHDVRSPVTAALGLVQLAQMRAEEVAKTLQKWNADETEAARRVVSTLELAQASMDRLARMTRVLFDVAGARSGRLVVTPAPCDLLTLVQEQVAAQRAARPDRTIQLHLPSAPRVRVLADADRIEEVLANLVSNALQYSDKGKPVTVRLEVGKHDARVSVEDKGVGVPREEQERVWQPFHRAPGTEPVNTDQGNLGVGLHICKQIVELHCGGRVGLESEMGRGSTFWFSLPLAADAGLEVPSRGVAEP